MEYLWKNDFVDESIATLLVEHFYEYRGTSEQLWSLVEEIEGKKILLSPDTYRQLVL
jgi:hypothetical protein